MAYEQEFDDEENAAPGAAPSPGGGVVAPSAPAASSPVSRPSTGGSGSGFTNLTSYVDANAGRAEGMAKQVTGGIDNKLAGVQGNAQTFKDNAEKAIQGGTVQAGMTGTYNGPAQANDLQGYQEIGQGFQGVDNSVKALGSTEGRAQTAKDTFGGEKYSKGENTLDGFVMGSGAGGQHLGQYQDQYSKSYQAPTPQATNYLKPRPGQVPTQAPAPTTPGQGWADIVAGVNGGITQGRATSQVNNTNTLAAAETAKQAGIQEQARIETQAREQASIDAQVAANKVAADAALKQQKIDIAMNEKVNHHAGMSDRRAGEATAKASDLAARQTATARALPGSVDPDRDPGTGWGALIPPQHKAAETETGKIARQIYDANTNPVGSTIRVVDDEMQGINNIVGTGTRKLFGK